jgi:CDP-diglyceride synthetase
MLTNQGSVPLANLVWIFCILLLAGFILTIPLYKFNMGKFIKSKLFIKIIFWVPIFVVLVGVLYANQLIRLFVLTVVLLAALGEFVQNYVPKNRKILFIFFVLFTVFLAHFYFLGTLYKTEFINLLITLAFATVLADVTAFFFGNYFGKHKLPVMLNKNKSWEGVFGELVGALLGVVLVNAFILPVLSIWLFLPIGFGSIIGDLTNSFVKRKLNIKDWSSAIPGHGGFIDRLSSIAGSTFLLYYFLKLTGI